MLRTAAEGCYATPGKPAMSKRHTTDSAVVSKRFCCIPSHYLVTAKPDARTKSCGECQLLRFVESLRTFSKAAVVMHNTECLRVRDKYVADQIRAAKADMVEEHYRMHGEVVELEDIHEADVDVAAILADYSISAALDQNEYLHENMATLERVFDHVGGELTYEIDDTDGMIDADGVIDAIDDLDYSEWVISDLRIMFKDLGIPLVPYRCSYTAGAGLRKHVNMTQHDADAGKC